MKSKRNIPPKLAERFLMWFLRDDLAEEVLGDLDEKFSTDLEEKSAFKARINYWYQVINYLRPFAIRKSTSHHLNHYAMYRSYFKIGWRNLLKNKGYSLINISGLALGMAVAILTGLWVYDELSFNKNHENYEDIAQVMQNQTFEGKVDTWRNQAMQLGPELRNSYGNNFQHVVMSSFTRSPIFTFDKKTLTKSGNFMEAEAPELLSLKMVKGTRAGLKNPNSILLSESFSKALFGGGDPLGEIIKIDNKLDVKVTGVYEDLPHNSTFKDLQFIAPWDLMVKNENLEERVGWGNSWFQTFVQVAEKIDLNKASNAIKYAKFNLVDEGEKNFKPELFLHPMAKWYLFSQFENGANTGGRIQFVWLFGVIGIFVLLLACINFMNLSTARSEKRMKEVGIRKVVGSLRSQLISQFIIESLSVVVLAFILAILLAKLVLPWFNNIADKELSILWTNPVFCLTGIAFIFITAFIAGSYPAFYLSAFKPIKVLKGTFRAGRFASIPRKVLVTVQFTVSITLIIGTIIVYQQVQFAKNRPIGYEVNSLITIPMKTAEVHKNYNTFRNHLLATATISEVALSESTITNTGITNSGFEWKGKDPNRQEEIITNGVNHEFGKTVGWKIKEGRDFSRDYASDSMGFILSETAVEYMGLEKPIGETIKAFGKTYTVIGVVEDMVTQSLYEPVRQTIFYIDIFDRIGYINVKINPQVNVSTAIAEIEEVFKKHNPSTPFEYNFADEEFANKFAFEERVGKLAGTFAIISVFISCLGLLGLAAFVAEQRTKEIGIRKILGASVANLWSMLSKDFVILVMAAFLIAIPISYYFLDGWLQQYEYRVGITWWVFGAAGIGALVITLLTVSFQAIKAAVMNPVKSLRSE